MTALDSDLFTLFLQGHPAIAAKVSTVSQDELALPVVVVEEVMRGRLNAIRQAQSKKKVVELTEAYERLANSVEAAAHFPILNYTPEADVLTQQWRTQKIKVGMQDLRIGAICVSQNIRLATRNRHDFERVPGLVLELWI
jgi:tRNA(fMet)-specific endonuclease VapC